MSNYKGIIHLDKSDVMSIVITFYIYATLDDIRDYMPERNQFILTLSPLLTNKRRTKSQGLPPKELHNTTYNERTPPSLLILALGEVLSDLKL